VYVQEDMPENGIMNMSDYFSDDSGQPLAYEFDDISDTVNIVLALNDSRLDVVYLEENWTGEVELKVRATNIYQVSAVTDSFSIVVQKCNDAPFWSSTPPGITMMEDMVHTTTYSLFDHVEDVDGGSPDISVISANSNVDVVQDIEGHLIIAPVKNYHGQATIDLIAQDSLLPNLTASVSIPVEILPEDDLPQVRLIAPNNGAAFNLTYASLSHGKERISIPMNPPLSMTSIWVKLQRPCSMQATSPTLTLN